MPHLLSLSLYMRCVQMHNLKRWLHTLTPSDDELALMESLFCYAFYMLLMVALIMYFVSMYHVKKNQENSVAFVEYAR